MRCFTGTHRDIESWCSRLLASGSNAVFEPGEAAARSDRRPRVLRLREARRRAAHAADQRLALRNLARGDVRMRTSLARRRDWIALTMTKILGIETGRNAASARIIPEQVASRKFDHGKRIEEAYRELSLASERHAGSASRRGSSTRRGFSTDLQCELGSPDDDVTRLITHYESWANVEVMFRASRCGVGRASVRPWFRLRARSFQVSQPPEFRGSTHRSLERAPRVDEAT